MEEMNKDIINEEVIEDAANKSNDEIVDEIIDEAEVLGEVPCCCCGEKAKVSINAICVWIAGLVALFFGINAVVSFAGQLKAIMQQAAEVGGTLADFGIKTSDLISTVGTSIAPMFIYAVILYAIGRILWVQKNK